MSMGFRKSLFGFNRDDVMEYFRQQQYSFSEKEEAFAAQITILEDQIKALHSIKTELEKKNAELSVKAAEYDEKKAEMERLSENIGKLYLVAQTNAKTIMANAEETSKMAEEEISRNVSTIENTHASLDVLKNSITETAERFNDEVAALMKSLEETKEKIISDSEENKSANDEFAQLLEAVSR